MPLTDRHKHLLHELFGIPYESKTVVVGEFAYQPLPMILDYQQSPKQRLDEAIVSIDSDETRVQRVAEILAEYEQYALDRSTIDRNGYSLRPNRNIRAIRRALFSYTGLISETGQGNQTRLG